MFYETKPFLQWKTPFPKLRERTKKIRSVFHPHPEMGRKKVSFFQVWAAN